MSSSDLVTPFTEKTIWFLVGPLGRGPDEIVHQPLFDRVSEWYRERGATILNPADIDLQHAVHESERRAWWWYARRHLEMMMNADGVIVLPGWREDTLSRFEALTASHLGMHEIIVHPEAMP